MPCAANHHHHDDNSAATDSAWKDVLIHAKNSNNLENIKRIPHPDSQLRSSKIEASFIDSEFIELLFSNMESIFKYATPGFIEKYKAEIDAVVTFSWLSLSRLSATTPGMSLKRLKYHCTHYSTTMTLYCLLAVLTPYVWKRLFRKSISEQWRNVAPAKHRLINHSKTAWNVIYLLNFLRFLQNGSYRCPIERLLSIKLRPSSLSDVTTPHGINFDYLNRSVLWDGIVEFAIYVWPVFQFSRIRSAMSKLLSSIASSSSSISGNECLLCHRKAETIEMPYKSSCCTQNVYCYYCIKAEGKTTLCGSCNTAVKSSFSRYSPIQ